jgi:4'-phosphopantetheinyl transferase
MLSPDERERVAGMPASLRAREFIVGRAGSRELIARICGCEPGDIIFNSTANGKPGLAYPNTSIAFNLTHSGGMCAFAFAQTSAIGIDIEQSHSHFHDLLETALTPRESAQLALIPASRRQEAFFRTWVAKEAYLKATGEGLAGGFHSLELDLDALPELRPVTVQSNNDRPDQWLFHNFEVGSSLVGAVAVKTNGRNYTVKIHHEGADNRMLERGMLTLGF